MIRRILLSFISFFAVSAVADAVVLFPFFGDLAPDYEVVCRLDDGKGHEQIVYRGKSGWGGFNDCVGFMDDVIPEGVSKSNEGLYAVVYKSAFHEEQIDVIDTDSAVSAVYIVAGDNGLYIYYSESSGTQQKEWQSDILGGRM